MNDLTTPHESPTAMRAALFAVAVTSIATYYLFGLIHKFTHHRPLGAATLAVMVLGVFFGSWLLAARLGVNKTAARVALGVALLHVVTRAFI